MKTNAKEYLKEFAASQQDWLKALIYDAIETNGNITGERKNEIFEHLTNCTDLNVTEPNINQEDLESEIYITELVHKSGVNALKNNQTIKFHSDITILYGLNGAGKSSYFKILNEIVGGNQKKEILSNIYSDTADEIDVQLRFKKNGGQAQEINWDGSRALDFLNKCKVFDTSYLNGLLETRKADTTLIQPLGLNLFTYLVELVDNFKEKVKSKADKERREKPVIELKYLRDEIRSSFENHNISKEVKKQIEDLFVFSEENTQKLITTKQELSGLKQINIQDKIRLKNNDKRELEDLHKYIEDTHIKISDSIIKTTKLLKTYSENREANNLAKKQFEVLSNVPANNTEEWKEFIKAGEKYTSKLDGNKAICAYCLQPLTDDNSIQLVKSYGSFLKDESEQKLNKSNQDIDSLKQELDEISTELEIKENIATILKITEIENFDKTLFQLIININTNIENNRKKLLTILKNREINNVKLERSDTKILFDKLSKIIANIKKEVLKLSNNDTEKQKNIDMLEKEIKVLLENESIKKQQEIIKKWLDIDSVENELKRKVATINTTKISNLSKTAHNDLLTEILKTNFSNELSSLGYENLDVKIENEKGIKGVSNTKLTLTKNKEIKAVLSEGEQKAVALALFVAEAKTQKSINPIILDDPVNSLDHKIAGNFAECILQLENQIILFNHNRLFLDAFETSKENHICKSIDSDCSKNKGKHIRVYQVNSEGKNAKGVLIDYKSNKAKNHILEVKKLLNTSPFKDQEKVAILVRKAVECVINEVVFNNQVPTKYSNKNSRISWVELKKMKNDKDTIDKLETIHGRVSSGAIHNGTENEENPIEVDKFRVMISDIENIITPVSNEKQPTINP